MQCKPAIIIPAAIAFVYTYVQRTIALYLSIASHYLYRIDSQYLWLIVNICIYSYRPDSHRLITGEGWTERPVIDRTVLVTRAYQYRDTLLVYTVPCFDPTRTAVCREQLVPTYSTYLRVHVRVWYEYYYSYVRVH